MTNLDNAMRDTPPKTWMTCVLSLGITLKKVLGWFGNNPITLREFIRYARSGRFFLLMALVLTVCTTILCFVWAFQPEDSQYPPGRLLFFSMLTGELTVIILLLPGLVAHALITERDENTFPLLLTTPLTSGRILGGKLISTLGVMVLLIVSTFPLIGICMTRGGVSPYEVIMGELALLITSYMSASFAIHYALKSTTTLKAILMTHVSLFFCVIVGGAFIAFSLGICLGILELLIVTINSMTLLRKISSLPPKLWIWTFSTACILVSTGMATWLLYTARSHLRFPESRIRRSWEMRRIPVFQMGQVTKNQSKTLAMRSWWDYRDGQNPYYIRERFGYAAAKTLFSLPSWYVIFLFTHVLFLLTPIQEGRWVALATLVMIGQMAPAYAAPLFAGEKERGTWDSLMTSVSNTRVLLHGKLKGALSQCLIRAGVLFLTPFAIAFVLRMVINLFSRMGLPAFSLFHLFWYAVILLLNLAFVVVSTTYFSIGLSKVSRAINWGYMLVILYFLLPFVMAIIARRWMPFLNEKLILQLSPLYLLATFPESSNGVLFSLSDTFAFVTGLHFIVYGTGTALFYYLSIRRLNRVG